MMQNLAAESSISNEPVPFRRDKIAKLPAAPDSQSWTRKQEDSDTGLVLLQSAGVGIYGLDLNGFVTFVNPAARRMTGWTLADLQGRTQHSMVHHSHADGRNYPREECPIYMAFHDGRTHCREDEVFWRKDGSSFPVEYTSTPVFSSRELTGAVVVFSDITDRTRKRDWDQARIDILQEVLRGRSLDETADALCNAFSVFQPGCQLTIRRASPEDDLRNPSAMNAPATQTIRHILRNAAGTWVGLLQVDCRSNPDASDSRKSALAEVAVLLEAAFS